LGMATSRLSVRIMRRAQILDCLPKISRLCAVASLLALESCGGSGGSSSQPPPQSPEVNSVIVSPATAQLYTGQNQLFTAQVTGTGAYSSVVTWSVNGLVGGSSSEGMISSSGQYTAPATQPNPSNIMVTATSVQTPGVFGVATADVYAPTVLASITPSAASAGENVVLDLQNATDFPSVVFPGVNGTSISLGLDQQSGNNFTIAVPFGATSGNVYVNSLTLQGTTASTNSVSFTRLPNLLVHAPAKDLSSGETLQLDWRLLGASSPSVITWTTDLGSINSQGSFQAPVVLSESYSHVTGCVQGTNSCNTVLLRILPFQIEPTDPMVSMGNTVQLSAIEGDSALSPQWSVLAEGGSISTGGLFTAPTVAAQAGGVSISATTGTTTEQNSVAVSGAFPGLVNRVYDYANFNTFTPAEATFTRSVAVSGNRAYALTIGDPYFLEPAYISIDVYDITNPDQPVWIDAGEAAANVGQIFAYGDTLFGVGFEPNTLTTYSLITQIPTLTAITSLPSFAGTSFNNGVLYVVDTQLNGITTMPVDTYTTNAGTAVHNHYDLPQPDTDVTLQSLAGSGNILYGSYSIDSNNNPQFKIVAYDISQSPPSLLSSVTSTSNDGMGTAVDSLYVVGNQLFANSQVYDISNGAPVLVTTIPVTLSNVFGAQGTEVLAQGGFSTYGGSANYVIVDTSSPSAPAVHANVVDMPSADIFNPIDATWVNNNTFYAADGTGGIAVYDISAAGGPANASIQGFYAYTYAQALNQQTLYMASVYPSGAGVLGCLDVSKGTPKLLGTLAYDNDSAYAVQVSGTTVFLGLANYLKVINVSNPALPVEIGTAGVPVGALALLGNDLFVGTTDGRLVVYDVTSPTSPNQLSSTSMPVASAMTVSGHLLLVAAGDSGLLVYDVSNPSNPVMQSHYLADGSAPIWDVAATVSGEAILAADSDGVIILNLANPSTPELVAQQPLPFFNPFPAPSSGAGILTAFTIAYQKNLIYVGTGIAGIIFAYDASVPANPRLMAMNFVSPAVPDIVSAITVGQNNIYADVVGDLIQLDNTVPQNSIEQYLPPAALSYATQITSGDSRQNAGHGARFERGLKRVDEEHQH
jgi:hypothetical protein